MLMKKQEKSPFRIVKILLGLYTTSLFAILLIILLGSFVFMWSFPNHIWDLEKIMWFIFAVAGLTINIAALKYKLNIFLTIFRFVLNLFIFIMSFVGFLVLSNCLVGGPCN